MRVSVSVRSYRYGIVGVCSVQAQIDAVRAMGVRLSDEDVATSLMEAASLGLSFEEALLSLVSSNSHTDGVTVCAEGDTLTTPYGDGVLIEGARSDGVATIQLQWGTLFCNVSALPNVRIPSSSRYRSDSVEVRLNCCCAVVFVACICFCVVVPYCSGVDRQFWVTR